MEERVVELILLAEWVIGSKVNQERLKICVLSVDKDRKIDRKLHRATYTQIGQVRYKRGSPCILHFQYTTTDQTREPNQSAGCGAIAKVNKKKSWTQLVIFFLFDTLENHTTRKWRLYCKDRQVLPYPPALNNSLAN